MITKHETEEKIKFVRDAFWFSLGAYALATNEPTKNYLNKQRIKIYDYSSDIHVFAENTEPPSSTMAYEIGFAGTMANGSAKSFVRQTFLYMIQETFESAQKYAKATNQESAYKKEEWHAFARHLRNAIAHNGTWNITGNPTDLPTTFRNKTIDISMNHSELGDFIGWFYGAQLCASISLWVSQN